MDAPGAATDTLFVGDLDDPWIAEIAAALPAGAIVWNGPEDLGDSLSRPGADARTLVLQRAVLGQRDREQVAAWKEAATGERRVLLIVGPHSRYHQVERWATLADVVLAEATAVETIGRHFLRPMPPIRRPPVTIIAAEFELRSALVDLVRAAGYPAAGSADWSGPANGPAIWEVPLLDREWPRELARHSRHRPVLALMGIADRQDVVLARAAGAAACLDSACEFDDLAFVLARLAEPTAAGPGPRIRRDRAAVHSPRQARDPAFGPTPGHGSGARRAPRDVAILRKPATDVDERPPLLGPSSGP